MAGGKASPRQKMINMMYLVLTALLAMNVSAEILQSFVTIANSLQVTAEQMNKKNNELTHDLLAILDDQAAKGKTENQYLRPVIEEVAKESDKMLNSLEYYIDRIKSDSIGAYDTTKKTLSKLDENQKNYRFWMKLEGTDADNEGRGSGEARKLKEKLDKFIDWANSRREKVITDKPNDDEKKRMPTKAQMRPYGKLCLDPNEDNTVPQNSEMKKKPWEYYTFHGAPAIANIALLQKYKTDIRFLEAELLEFLKGRISDRPLFTINKLNAVIAPESNRVLAGMPFTAQIYVTMSMKGPSDKAPRFSGNGVKINPDKTSATLKVLASAANLPKDKPEGVQSYSFSVQVPKSDGTWETLKMPKDAGKFTVVKPDLEIGNFKLNPLYRDCRNELDVKSNALGNRFNPKFKVVGGEVTPHPTIKTKVALIPNAATLKLSVSNDFDGQIVEIGTRDFKVNAPPAPDIHIKVDGKDWNPSQKISPSSTVEIIAKADPTFYDALPKDARYKIEGVEIKKRCSLAPASPAGINPAPSDVSHAAKVKIALGKAELTKGCTITFEILKVSRVNFQDKQIEVTKQLTATQLNIMGRID